jgi:signal transduction histidine kinase/PAS domain-containing protein
MAEASESQEQQQYSPAEMQQSEERYRALFLQEQTRARHLSLINEVQKCALATRDNNTFLHQVTRAIQSHFSDCDVTFFLCAKTSGSSSYGSGSMFSANISPEEDSCADMRVVAAAGDHGLSPEVGVHWPGTAGLPGQAVQYRRTAHFDSGSKEHYDPLWHAASMQAGMCVPVITSGHLLGVICMQSAREASIDARDAVALQTAAAIIASHLESGRLYNEMRELSAFNQTLITTMLHSMMVINGDGIIKVVNARLCQTLGVTREQVVNQPVERVFGEVASGGLGNLSIDGMPRAQTLREAIADVTHSGTPYELPEIQLDSPEGVQVFDVRLFRVYFRGEAQVVLLLINLTRRWRMFRQLRLMNEIGRLFQSSLDINEVLHTVLTCITAGAGLGFNRAFLLLRHDEAGAEESIEGSSALRGAMALGPSSSEEAARVWRELGSRNLSLAEMLEGSDPLDLQNLTPLQENVLKIEIDLKNPCFPALERAMQERRTLCVEHEEFFDSSWFEGVAPDSKPKSPCEDCTHRAQCDAAFELFTGSQIAIAPLLAKDRVVGVVLADNLYSGAPIEPDDVQMLDVLAQQGGLTVANALAYQALQNAQNELVNAERLAVVGEMAARVSHEIRNPLATVGGFARSILRDPHDADDVERKTQIIVGEVARLEELLGDLLDMARPRGLNAQPESLSAVIEHAVLLADADIQAMKVRLEKHYEELPPVLLDRSRAVQAILNIVRNGAQAMPDGGVLSVSTRRSPDGRWAQVEIRDTGVGMSSNAIKHVFDPFFSTKLKGSGLGLAVTRRIMQDHDGDIDVFSEPDKGTTFVLSFPLRLP